MSGIPVDWAPRDAPLAPAAIAAWGRAARALADRLRSVDDAALARLSGVRADDLLVVIGDELPWADGALYLGHDPAAPALLLPTALRPTVPVDLLARALGRLGPGPLAVIPALRRVVPLIGARPVSRERLP